MSAARTIAGDMDPEAIGDMIADGIRTAAAMRPCARRWSPTQSTAHPTRRSRSPCEPKT